MKNQLMILICLLAGVMNAQSDYQMKGNDKGIDVNFMTSYYQQDGENSAVEGGQGDEKLTDFANIVVVNVPLDSVRSLTVTLGIDAYSSASTDMIDADISSASAQDSRKYGSVSYKKKNLKSGFTYGVKGGFSKEYDYISFSGGLNIAKEWNQGNSEIGFSTQAFIDKWTIYFPEELEKNVSVPTSNRNSFNASLVYSQVVNRRMQFAVSAEAIYMNGLLSTPFHRVFFSDQDGGDIERLPDARLKVPISLRLNYFLSDRIILRSYYRYYFDDFGIQAHTANLEIPIRITDAFKISPFFRYHTQEGSKYFAPFKENVSTDEFYSSDFDLSTLSSMKMGMAFGYYPSFGLANGSLLGKDLSFKSIELRLSYYERDTDLTAFLGSINFAFRI